MTRLEAAKLLRFGRLTSAVFNHHAPFPFAIHLESEYNGKVYSAISYHNKFRVKLNPKQVLAFIKRNYPKK